MGDSHFGYRQWDDNPTWCLDRGRDDKHNDPPDVPLGANSVSGFQAAIVSQREKHAQMADAASAFIGFKKVAMEVDCCVKCGEEKDACVCEGGKKEAGILSTVGHMAMNHPRAAGAAVGAAGGAIAGGPNHRLGGAVAGGALGAAAGHGAAGMMQKAEVGAVKQLGNQALHAEAPAAAAAVHQTPTAGPTFADKPPISQTMAGNAQLAPHSSRQTMPPRGGNTAVMPAPEKGSYRSPQTQQYAPGDVPGGAPGPAIDRTPKSEMGAKNQAAFNQHIQGMLAGKPAAPAGAGPALAGGTPLDAFKPTTNLNMGMKKVASLPFAVVVSSKKAIGNGGLTTFVKTAEVIGEIASAASEHPRFRIPGISALVAGVDDVAQIGRQKLQAEFNRRSAEKRRQQQQPKLAGLMPPIGAVGKRAIQSAAGWGAAGAVTGAITAKPGNRMKGALIGGAAGAAGGAVAPTAEHYAGKMLKMATPFDGTPLMDMRQRAADRYPEKVSIVESIRTDAKKAMHLLEDKSREIRDDRLDISQPKVAADHAGLDMREMASLGGMPKRLMSRSGALTAGAGALLGGGLAFMASRGKEEHGGRSQAEVDLGDAAANQPEQPEGIRATIGKHVVNMHRDVAEQMRKHPIAACAIGAGAGAGLALRLAPLLGIGK